MAKKEKVMDLKPEKVTAEQLEQIQTTVSTINKAQNEIGGLEVKKHQLMHAIGGEEKKLSDLQAELIKEYGTVNININNGEINYPENGEVNKKD
tara:strand:- start:155 stop:436 length:282 start_codon:yes stop_codon:yes gene_type:complete